LVLDSNIASAAGGFTAFKVDNAVKILRRQIGLVDAQEVSLRIAMVSCWSTIAELTSQSEFALRPAALNKSGVYWGWLEDQGTLSRPSHVHWTWPVTDRNVILRSKEDPTVVIFQLDTHPSFLGRVHLHVLWKPAGGDPVPSFRVRSVVDDLTEL
jgi:hypothetical protein